MKIMTGRFLLTALLTLFAVNAHAILTVQVSESADFSGAITAADGDNDGVLSLATSTANWTVVVANGFTNPAIGSSLYDEMHLNSVNVSGGIGTLYIRLSDTGYAKDGNSAYKTLVGGVLAGTGSFQSYVDVTDTLFGKGTLLSDSGMVLAGAFSDTNTGSVSLTAPHSMSIYAAISHTAANQISSFDYNVQVPEPATLALMGLGLAGLGFSCRRKA